MEKHYKTRSRKKVREINSLVKTLISRGKNVDFSVKIVIAFYSMLNSRSHIFRKNFVKAMVLPKKLQLIDLTKFFFSVFPHCFPSHCDSFTQKYSVFNHSVNSLVKPHCFHEYFVIMQISVLFIQFFEKLLFTQFFIYSISIKDHLQL